MKGPLASASFRTSDCDFVCEVFQGDDTYVLRLSNHFGILAEDAVEDGPTVLIRFEAVSELLKERGLADTPRAARAGSPAPVAPLKYAGA